MGPQRRPIIGVATFLYFIGGPIVLENDVDHQVGVCFSPHRTQHRQEFSRGYNSRIPIQLRNSKTEGVTTTDCESNGSFNGDGCVEEKVWEYDGFARYRVVSSVPEVAIHWRFTWEPAAEFTLDELAEMKEKWQRRKSAMKESRSSKQPKSRGKPRQRLSGGASTSGKGRSLRPL